MTLNDGWARGSVRIVGQRGPLSQVPPGLVALAEARRDPRVLVLPAAVSDDASIDEVMTSLMELISAHAIKLRALRRDNDAELQVFLGWSPRAPQESLALDSNLVAAMAGLGAGLVVDTYSE